MFRPSTPVSTSIAIILCLAWFALWPAFFIAHGVIQNRWMPQDTSRVWVYMCVVAAVLFLSITGAYLWLIWNRWEPFPWRELGGLALYSLLSGWSGGNVALNLLNHSSAAPGRPAEFKIVGHGRTTVSLRIVGEDYDGITFKCGQTKWASHYHPETGMAPGLVYRGRLGLLWGEFKDK
jgi:hypothetical protein